MSIKENEVFSLQTPEHVISLATSGMLVSTDVNVWSGTKQDRGIAEQVARDKQAHSKACRVVKNLCASFREYDKVKNYRQSIYNWMTEKTYPWNKGQRYLFTANVQDFMQEWTEHEQTFGSLVSEMLIEYPNHIQKQKQKVTGQGEMFNENDYPSVEWIKQRMGCELFIAEVPEGDPRCTIANDCARDIRETNQRQARKHINNILNEQGNRLKDVMESIRYVLLDPKISVGKDGIKKYANRRVHDKTIDKAKEMCKAFSQSNIYNEGDTHTEIKSAAKVLDKVLDGVEDEHMRQREVVRERVGNEVKDILNKFNF